MTSRTTPPTSLVSWTPWTRATTWSAGGGADRQDPFWSRRLPSQLANGLISWITGVHLHDYGCALKAYRREIVRDIALYGEMHRFLPALARWVGAAVGEIPVDHHPRRRGTSKYGLGRTIRVVLDLMTVKFLMSYWTRPIQIFGLLGLVLGGAGLAAGGPPLLPEDRPRDGAGQPARSCSWRCCWSWSASSSSPSASWGRCSCGPTTSPSASPSTRSARSSPEVPPHDDPCRPILIVLLLAACGSGSKSTGSSASTGGTPSDFDFGANSPTRATAFGDSITRGVVGDRRHHPEQLPQHPPVDAEGPGPGAGGW